MIFLLGFGFIHYWRFYHLQGLINSKPELDSTVTVFLTVSSIIYYQYLFCCFIFYIFWGVGRVEVLGGNSCQICFFPYMTIYFFVCFTTLNYKNDDRQKQTWLPKDESLLRFLLHQTLESSLSWSACQIWLKGVSLSESLHQISTVPAVILSAARSHSQCAFSQSDLGSLHFDSVL